MEKPTDMSPFFYADHINTPLLMYHLLQDNTLVVGGWW